MTPKQGCPLKPCCTMHSAAPTLASGAQPMVRPYASGGWNLCTCSSKTDAFATPAVAMLMRVVCHCCCCCSWHATKLH